MLLSTSDLKELAQYAISAVNQAGQVVIEKSKSCLSIKSKNAGENLASQVVTDVDYLSQKIILDILEPTCKKYGLALLTEELPDNYERFEKDYFWCIDPLDGTLPFIEQKPGYAISIALVSREGIPVIGIILDPRECTLYHAIDSVGAYRNGMPFQLQKNTLCIGQKLMVISDRSFVQQDFYKDVIKQMGQVASEKRCSGVITRTQGGAVMNACWVLENSPACYFKFPKAREGGGCLWDYAASTCLYKEAGGTVTDIKGFALDLNRRDSVFLNHQGVIFSSDSDLAEFVIKLYIGYENVSRVSFE